MNRKDCLQAATKAVEDRGESHGDADSMAWMLSGLWSVTLGTEIPLWKVMLMLGQMKDARIIAGDETHADHWVDGCGYRALGCELAKD